MKKNKSIRSLVAAFPLILALLAANSCSTTTGTPVKQDKKQAYSHYRVPDPKRTTTRQGIETRHYIKKQKSKKPNY